MKFRERVEKMSQGPSVIFFGKFFFFLYGNILGGKKSPKFFSFSILYVVGTERDNRLGHCRFRFCQLAARARTKIKIKIIPFNPGNVFD